MDRQKERERERERPTGKDRDRETFIRQGDKGRQTNRDRDRDSSVQTEKCVVGHVTTEECLNTAAAFMDLSLHNLCSGGSMENETLKNQRNEETTTWENNNPGKKKTKPENPLKQRKN